MREFGHYLVLRKLCEIKNDIVVFLDAEHPGLTNVADILTVGISIISIVIAFASYCYTKNHDQQIAKFAQANEISSWVMHEMQKAISRKQRICL